MRPNQVSLLLLCWFILISLENIRRSILRDGLLSSKYGPDGKPFEHLSVLYLVQNFFCLLWSLSMMRFSTRNAVGAPVWTYWEPSVTNTISIAVEIKALQYISYPAQVLANSLKMIAVMVVSNLVYGVKYTFRNYLCSFLVARGVSFFSLSMTKLRTISKFSHPNASRDYGLSFLYLAFEGFTGASLDSIMKKYPRTRAWDMMLGMSFWGTIYNFLFLLMRPQSVFEAIDFCRVHPQAAWGIISYCAVGAVEQILIFLTITKFGSLTFSTIITTRKFFNFLVSSVLYGKPQLFELGLGMFMVFGGILFQNMIEMEITA